jgi:hypothetical protein
LVHRGELVQERLEQQVHALAPQQPAVEEEAERPPWDPLFKFRNSDLIEVSIS